MKTIKESKWHGKCDSCKSEEIAIESELSVLYMDKSVAIGICPVCKNGLVSLDGIDGMVYYPYDGMIYPYDGMIYPLEALETEQVEKTDYYWVWFFCFLVIVLTGWYFVIQAT